MSDSEARGNWIPRLSIARPVSVVMALLALLVVGTIAYLRIPLGLVPAGLEGNSLNVWIPYPNATAVEVEEKIARPVEEILATIPGIDKTSTSSQSNGCSANIRFRSDTDMQEAYAQVRDRMDRVVPELPGEVDRIWVRRWDSGDVPIMWMGAYLRQEGFDPYFILDTYVRPALQRIDGVGTVELHGGTAKQIHIELDQDKVRTHRVNAWEIGRSVSKSNVTIPSGHVYEGGQKILVRSVGKFRSLEEIRELVIDAEHNLRLQDVASVELRALLRESVSRIDGREALSISVMKTSTANVVDVTRRVRATLEELKSRPALHGVDFELFWDQGEHVAESLENLQTTAVWGGLFAVAILLYFLRGVRMTLIITMAIPLSVTAAITGLYFIGWSLNIVTMMGLMLSLGLVVDNAIVIVENIYRKRQEGVGATEASVQGAGEVSLAVTMATLTSAVVFLPLMLMSDDAGFAFYMLRLGMPVILGLLASLVIALAIIPLATRHLAAGGVGREPPLVGRLRRVYIGCLRWTLSNRLSAAILVAIALGSMSIPFNAMMKTDQQQGHFLALWLQFEMPSGQSLHQANRFMTGVEDTLSNHREEYNIDVVRTEFRNDSGTAQIVFRKLENNQWYDSVLEKILERAGLRDAPLTLQEVADDITERLVVPGGTSLQINWRGNDDDSRLALNLYGETTETLSGLAQEVERRLRAMPQLSFIQTDLTRGGTELHVQIDREKARTYGVDPQAISGTIAYSLRGHPLSKFRTEDGREVDIRMMLEEYDRKTIQQLGNLAFATTRGGEVPLEALASIAAVRTLGDIRREDRQTVLTVTANIQEGTDAVGLFDRIDAVMAGFEMPRGYRWDKGSRYVRLEESDQSQQFAALLSITFVFLLMGVLFESFVLPLSVVMAIPFSFFGVYWTLYLTDTPMDVLSGIGIVILIGVVVNNAIVLIDLTNRLRAQGMSRIEALLESGQHRFRPILMTTFTTIFGLVPMAVGNAKMIGMPYAPLGRTMIGGMLGATILTLLIVPLFYTFFDDLRTQVRRMLSEAFGSPTGP